MDNNSYTRQSLDENTDNSCTEQFLDESAGDNSNIGQFIDENTDNNSDIEEFPVSVSWQLLRTRYTKFPKIDFMQNPYSEKVLGIN